MATKGLSILAECEGCGKKFEVSKNSNLSYQVPYEVVSDGHIIMLTSYTCPHCGKVHYVQIDDSTTVVGARQTQSEFKRLARKQIATNVTPRKLNKKFKADRLDLASSRKALMEKYQGKMVRSTDGMEYEFELRFSV